MEKERYEVYAPGNGEYTEKKSRFLGEIAPVRSEEEAAAFIEAKKKQYHDARHHCSAYIIADETGACVSRFSDDGEPSGTAGRPILDVLEGAGIVNAVCVVTRYFGGVLLGTGGLVRAYSQSAKQAVSDAALLQRRQGIRLSISTDYNGYGRVEYLLRESQIPILGTDYGTDVTVECIVPEKEKDRLAAALTEATSGQAVLEFGEQTGFGISGGNVIIL